MLHAYTVHSGPGIYAKVTQFSNSKIKLACTHFQADFDCTLFTDDA